MSTNLTALWIKFTTFQTNNSFIFTFIRIRAVIRSLPRFAFFMKFGIYTFPIFIPTITMIRRSTLRTYYNIIVRFKLISTGYTNTFFIISHLHTSFPIISYYHQNIYIILLYHIVSNFSTDNQIFI